MYKKKGFDAYSGVITPFPNILFCHNKYVYADGYMTNTTPGTFNTSATLMFCGNSPFHTKYTDGDVSCRYFDVLCGANDGGSVYQKGCVYKSKYKITVMPSVDNDAPVYIGAGCRRSVDTPPSSIAELKERAGYQLKSVGVGNATSKPLVLTGWCSVAKVFGVDKDTIQTRSEYSFDYGNRPTNLALIDIVMQSAEDTGNLQKVYIDVVVEHYTKYYYRNDIADA